ncbi:MAG: TRAP transporter substrate-binding protein [Tissierellia bacterium]|nr:TRAP transporter substrate-binding protein [Tissierellia bacterium]
MKRLHLVVITILFFLVLTSCKINENEVTKENPIVWKLAHYSTEEHAWNKGALEFKKNVEQMTNGRLKIEVYPNGQLGSEEEVLNGILAQTVDMTISAESMAPFVPVANLMATPYLYNSEEEIIDVMNSKFNDKISKKLEEGGFKPLMYQLRTPRNLTSNKEIHNASDAKNIKIRLPNAPLSITSWASVGANTVVMGLSDTFTALNQGVVDSQENPYDLVYTQSFYDVQKYLIETNHVYGYLNFIVGKKQYDNLPDDIKTELDKACQKTQKYINDLYFDTKDDYKIKLEDTNIEFIEDVDRDSFKEKMVDAIENYLDDDTFKLYQEIQFWLEERDEKN